MTSLRTVFIVIVGVILNVNYANSFLSQTKSNLNVSHGVYVNVKECFQPSSTRSILNHGSFHTLSYTMNNIYKKKNATFLFLGGSITAHLRYYEDFVQILKNDSELKITTHNFGHGGPGPGYTLYCEQFQESRPDVVFIDYGVNEEPPSTHFEALIRKTLAIDSEHPPLIFIVNFINSVNKLCGESPNFLDLAVYYNLVFVDFCAIVNHCFQDWQEYTQDGVHPSKSGVGIITAELVNSWKYLKKLGEDHKITHRAMNDITKLDHFYSDSKSLGRVYDFMFCDTVLNIESNSSTSHFLQPTNRSYGFEVITRVSGYRGFESVKRCWEAKRPDSNITFQFYGKEVSVAVYQHPRFMGIFDACLDIDTSVNCIRNITSYFEGYPWHSTGGRQIIYPLFKNLDSDSLHSITFLTTRYVGNPQYPGHNMNVIALLYSSQSSGLRASDSHRG